MKLAVRPRPTDRVGLSRGKLGSEPQPRRQPPGTPRPRKAEETLNRKEHRKEKHGYSRRALLQLSSWRKPPRKGGLPAARMPAPWKARSRLQRGFFLQSPSRPLPRKASALTSPAKKGLPCQLTFEHLRMLRWKLVGVLSCLAVLTGDAKVARLGRSAVFKHSS